MDLISSRENQSWISSSFFDLNSGFPFSLFLSKQQRRDGYCEARGQGLLFNTVFIDGLPSNSTSWLSPQQHALDYIFSLVCYQDRSAFFFQKMAGISNKGKCVFKEKGKGSQNCCVFLIADKWLFGELEKSAGVFVLISIFSVLKDALPLLEQGLLWRMVSLVTGKRESSKWISLQRADWWVTRPPCPTPPENPTNPNGRTSQTYLPVPISAEG